MRDNPLSIQGKKILEIGSGNNPNPRSAVLCDRYIHDNGQRAGKFSIVINRPTVVADAYKLPFKDKSFDYVICSHILEHMEKPDKFISEIVRVAGAGYIEVPSIHAERLFGWKFHLWYCRKTGKGITLYRKSHGEMYGGFFHRLIAQRIWFRRFFERHERYFNIQYEWTGKPEIRIHRTSAPAPLLAMTDRRNWDLLRDIRPDAAGDLYYALSFFIRRFRRKTTKIVRALTWLVQRYCGKQQVARMLLPYLFCLGCRGTLEKKSGNDRLVCLSCRTTYPVDGVIPVMLTPSERAKGY